MPPLPPQIPGLTDWRALARSGFAIVWQARQESLNRLVAVKVDQRPLDTESEQRRFLREAGAAGRLSGHPGIVTVHDAGILEDARPYLVMELCPGGSLTKWLTADPRPTEERVREVGVRIADALAAAHARGVLHRDVKPANILIDAYDNAGLADFGLAALPDPGMELSETIEAITPAYAPPEAFERKPPTEYGDVFALAATLYALLAGHPPRGEIGKTPSIAETMERLQRPVAPIPGVDPGLMELLLTALDDEPDRRPSAAYLHEELAALDLSVASVVEPGVAPPAENAPSEIAQTEVDRAEAARPEVARRETARSETARSEIAESPEPAATDPPEHDRNRRRTVVLLAAVIAAVVVAIMVTIASLRPDGAVGQSKPSVTAVSSPVVSSTPSPTPTAPPPVPVPAGFVDCSNPLGVDTYCADEPECWAGIISPFNVPAVATPVSCSKVHVYQTFAAGHLEVEIHRQSKLERDPRVRKVCQGSVVNSMLPKKKRRPDWEIIPIPPQFEADTFYRCIFGHGDHTGAYSLQNPR